MGTSGECQKELEARELKKDNRQKIRESRKPQEPSKIVPGHRRDFLVKYQHVFCKDKGHMARGCHKRPLCESGPTNISTSE